MSDPQETTDRRTSACSCAGPKEPPPRRFRPIDGRAERIQPAARVGRPESVTLAFHRVGARDTMQLLPRHNLFPFGQAIAAVDNLPPSAAFGPVPKPGPSPGEPGGRAPLRGRQKLPVDFGRLRAWWRLSDGTILPDR